MEHTRCTKPVSVLLIALYSWFMPTLPNFPRAVLRASAPPRLPPRSPREPFCRFCVARYPSLHVTPVVPILLNESETPREIVAV